MEQTSVLCVWQRMTSVNQTSVLNEQFVLKEAKHKHKLSDQQRGLDFHLEPFLVKLEIPHNVSTISQRQKRSPAGHFHKHGILELALFHIKSRVFFVYCSVICKPRHQKDSYVQMIKKPLIIWEFQITSKIECLFLLDKMSSLFELHWHIATTFKSLARQRHIKLASTECRICATYCASNPTCSCGIISRLGEWNQQIVSQPWSTRCFQLKIHSTMFIWAFVMEINTACRVSSVIYQHVVVHGKGCHSDQDSEDRVKCQQAHVENISSTCNL